MYDLHTGFASAKPVFLYAPDSLYGTLILFFCTGLVFRLGAEPTGARARVLGGRRGASFGGGERIHGDELAQENQMILVASQAMGTRFEIAMVEDRDPIRLRAAAEEALAEIDQIEDRLSLHRETSEIARVNALASQRPVRLSVEVFELLSLCLRLSRQMEGAFDPTVGPLMRCWGFVRGGGHQPSESALATARDCVGAQWVELDEGKREVFFRKPGMMLDLGAVGKGYALDVAVERLRDAGVAHALIHGGTSSVYGLGVQEDGRPWTVAVEDPEAEAASTSRLMSTFPLAEKALSVSAVWGKSFQSGTRRMGHVMDPRTGQPVSHTQLAAVSLASATESDALSTALLTLGASWIPSLRQAWPSAKAVVLSEEGSVTYL